MINVIYLTRDLGRPPITVSEQEAVYEDNEAEACEARLNWYFCTLSPGHAGPHIAGTLDAVCAVWEDDAPDVVEND